MVIVNTMMLFMKNTKAFWHDINKNSSSMRPDIIFETNEMFYIIDAKYYTEKRIRDLGVQDIAKQFMYHSAFEKEGKEKEYLNVFLSPGKEDKKLSRITMPLFKEKEIYSLIINGNEIF